MENEDKDKTVISSHVITYIFVGFVIFMFARSFWGNHIIDNWFETPREYQTQYWVYLEPSVKSTKNYRVKGDIEKVILGGEDGDAYYLRTVYWDNGGNTDFDDCQLTTPKGDYCLDNEDRGYTIRLGEHVDGT